MIHLAVLAMPLAMALAVPASVDRDVFSTPGSRMVMTPAQKAAALRPLVSSATECIARKVAGDVRLQGIIAGAAFNELIVESVPSCANALRAMIETYDELYGAGEGESFFMGPYLDGLPEAVTRRVKNSP